MKRVILLLLCLALVLPMAACSGQSLVQPGNFYYYAPDGVYESMKQVIVPEQRELVGMENDLDALLGAYLSGPQSRELESLIPRDAQLLSWELSYDTLTLNFSQDFAVLSGVELSVTCACIARTFLELVDVQAVKIQAQDALLDAQAYILLSDENLALYDETADLLATRLTVYYTDSQRRYLLGQEQSIYPESQDDLIVLLLEALLEPPSDSPLVSALPQGTTVLGYEIDDGLCTVNFSEGFERNAFGTSEAQRLSLLCVVNTLCQLDGITQVEFCTEGNLLVRYSRLNIPSPLSREEAAIGPVRTGVNEFDATLYLANGSSRLLTRVPTRIRQSAGLTQAELVVQALIDYTPINCFTGTVPAQTQINAVTTEGSLCRIDLSGEFLSANSNVPQSVRSIVASVCALEGIEEVLLTVDGETPRGALEQYFVPLSPSADWFV